MPPAVLLRLVDQVRRRVVLGSLLLVLVWAWVAALSLSAAWVFVQRLAWPQMPDAVSLAVPSVLLGGATAGALVYALLRAPSQLGAAMSLDQRFGLRERVTTSLTLDEHTASTPAGQALLADAEERARQVRVADRFPVTVPWKPAAALPVCCGAFVLLAMLFHPSFARDGQDDAAEDEDPVEVSKKLDDRMKNLAPKKPAAAKKAEEQPKDEDLAHIRAEIEETARKPYRTPQQKQDRIKDLTAHAEELKRQQREEERREAARKDGLRQSAEQLKKKTQEKKERLLKKMRDPELNEQQKKDLAKELEEMNKGGGAGKQAKDALERGDVQKAKDELQRLSKEQAEKEEKKKQLEEKKEKEGELKKEDQDELDRINEGQKQLEKDLAEMQELVEQAAKREEQLKEELKKEKEAAEKEEDPEKQKEHRQKQEELERELEEVQKNPLNEQDKQELKELAEQLKECKDCMKEGDGKGGKEGNKGDAAKKLAQAAQKMGKMGKQGNKQERKQMLGRVEAARKELSRQMQGGVGAGKRPEQKGETAEEERFLPGEWEKDKGKVQVVGEGPKGGSKFTGPKKPENMKEEIKQARQEAASAIDRQRLPSSARKMTRDYFEKLRDREGGKDKQP